MELKLRQVESISVLDISGNVSNHNFLVLKAGINKLLQAGKNQIILSLLDAETLEGEVLRELAIIDVFARELSGKIILVSNNEELKESVRLFSKPPVVPILSTVELALEYLKKAQENPEEEDNVSEIKKALEAKTKEVAALEARLKLLDPKEMKDLRAVNATLRAKAEALEAQVDELLKAPKNPGDADGFLEKITALENTIKQYSAVGAKP